MGLGCPAVQRLVEQSILGRGNHHARRVPNPPDDLSSAAIRSGGRPIGVSLGYQTADRRYYRPDFDTYTVVPIRPMFEHFGYQTGTSACAASDSGLCSGLPRRLSLRDRCIGPNISQAGLKTAHARGNACSSSAFPVRYLQSVHCLPAISRMR